MITLWTESPKNKVFEKLSPVLNVPGASISVSSAFDCTEGTKIIVAMGSKAFKRLQEEKIVAGNRTITSSRTKFLDRNGVAVLCTYNPDIGDIDHGYYVDTLTDITLALRYALTGHKTPQYGTYHYRGDFSDLCKGIEQKYGDSGSPVSVMMDSETVGLDPYALPNLHHPGAYIVTLQASHQIGTADLVRFHSRQHEEERLHSPEIKEQLEFLLRSPKVKMKGANFKYDLHWLWVRAKQRCTNFVFDTTLVGSLLDENRSNALDVHTKIYSPRMAGYSDEFDRTVDKSRMDLVPEQTLLGYAGGDVDGGLEVAERMKDDLCAVPELARFYVNILHPAARAFEVVEQGGVLVDLEAYKELKADLEAEQVRLIKDAHKILGGRIVAKHYDSSRVGGINLTKAALLTDFMFSPMGLNLKPKAFTPKPGKDGVPRPATSMEHLEMFADVPEASAFVELMGDYQIATKSYNTYVEGFLSHLRSDGRFHPTYFLFAGNRDEGDGGTTSGRLSCHDPAFQTLTKHNKWAKRIRRCFPAPPGYVVVERDYSQGELRVVACVANETNMIAAYKAGMDLHARTGAKTAGMTYEQMMELEKTNEALFAELRQLAKAGNFGLLYGMGPEGFLIYATKNYGVKGLTLGKAKEFRDAFFEEYSGLLVYHDTYKKFAREHKYVPSPLGRIRHLPLVDSPNREVAAKEERRAINAPIQGCLSDMLIWAMSLEHKAGLTEIAPSFGAIHDAAYNYVPEDKVDEIIPQLLAVQENLPFEVVGWQPQLPFPADAKFGPNMADLTKFKKKG